MTTTKIDIPTPDQKELERERIAEDIKKYLAKGGKITQCPRNAYTDVDVEGKPIAKRKFSALNAPDSLNNPIKRQMGAFIPPNKREQ